MCLLVVLFASGFLNVLLLFDASEAMRFFKWKEVRSLCLHQRVNLSPSNLRMQN